MATAGASTTDETARARLHGDPLAVALSLAWYAYDEYLIGAVWGHVCRRLATAGPLPPVESGDSLDYGNST